MTMKDKTDGEQKKTTRRQCLSAIGGGSIVLPLSNWREPDEPVGWDAPLDGKIKGVDQEVWWGILGGHQVTGTVTFLDTVSGTLRAIGRDDNGKVVARESKSVNGDSARITIKTGVPWQFIDIVEYRFD